MDLKEEKLKGESNQGFDTVASKAKRMKMMKRMKKSFVKRIFSYHK